MGEVLLGINIERWTKDFLERLKNDLAWGLGWWLAG